MRTRTALPALVVVALAAALPAAGPVGAATAAPALPDPLGEPQAFASPPAATRPKFRWWWATPYDLAEFGSELDAMAGAGFGGAEAAFNSDGWATESQRQALQTSLEAAERNDMSLDMTMGYAWPVQSPAATAENGLAEQELDYGRHDLLGPSTFSGAVPGSRGGGGKLVAVTAAKVTSEGAPDPVSEPGPNFPRASTAPARSTVLDPASLVDLTDRVDDSGSIEWDVSEGHWILFGLYQRAASEAVMDHLNADSAQAVTGYIDEHMLGAENTGLLPGTGGSFFEDSLELDVNDLFWTGRFADEFQRRRGYDVTKFLPVLFVAGEGHYPVPEESRNPDFDLPGDAGARVRHDYYETLGDLYASDHIVPFQRWAETHGMQYRNQPAYGAPFDLVRGARETAKAGGIADDESLNAGDPASPGDPRWRFAMDHFRSLVGGVHQAERTTEISTELGAIFWRSFEPELGDYKALMDKEWAAGITRPIVHGYAYQPLGAAWPGRDQFFGIVSDSWNARTFPEWAMWRPLADYWARGNLVLQQGVPRVDVAVYRDGFTTTAATFSALVTNVANHQVDPLLPVPVLTDEEGRHRLDHETDTQPHPMFDGERIERAGYTFEYIDPLGLTERAAGRGKGGVLYPGKGPAYRALVVDERALPAAAAEAIATASANGLAVVLVGSPPDRGTSFADANAENERVRRAVERILSAPRVRRVAEQADVREALAQLGVEPGAAWSEPLPVYSAHRLVAEADYFYLWNAGTEPVRFTGSFRAQGAPHTLDLWTGTGERVANYRTGRGRVDVPLALGPGETRVLAFRHRDRGVLHVVSTDAEQVAARGDGIELRDTRSGARTAVLSDGSRREATLPDLPAPLAPASWHLHVDEVGPSGTTPIDTDLDHLDDWRNIPAVRESSGTGTYTTTVTVPAEWVASDRGVYLDAGRCPSAMQVYVNGRRAAPDVTPARRFYVTDLLHAGDNELKVVVTTTLKNRLVALTREPSHGFSAIPAQRATRPYGLIGPLALIPFGRAVISG